MVTVHHLNNSRSQRVLWLLEELGVPYEVRRYERDARTMWAPESLKAVHPLGKSPVITDGELTLAESGAILEYLVERYGAGRLAPPAGSPARERYRYWLHYAEGSLMPLLVMKLVFARLKTVRVPFFVKPVVKAIVARVNQGYLDPQLHQHLAFIEGELARGPWFAGEELSAADVQLSFPVEAAAARAGLDEFPKLKDWLARVRTRPAYRRALERGGPFEVFSA
ncbi:MAG: glutathione S-transferase family protein [Gammaproteobacteria bacterium]